ncbi:hypothetical protein Vafri_11858 [Volvox africanus]|uniref:Uncharacterized protein n=2 Tax=Volvox africanus TaxID=51714 RepID=A0A8J4F123_9CHLO|nr:hypothetical protein Vafri_11858 [Volvox africanus]
MAMTSHPPGTLPPPSTQPRHAHSPSPYGSSSEPYGDPLAPNPGRHHTLQAGGYPGPYPPPPPTHDSPPSQAGGPIRPPVSAALSGGGGGGEANHVSVPATVYVTTPKIEMQPWARKAWRWLVDNTAGVARVDLRRPTPPLPEQYDGNLLFVRSRKSVVSQHDGGWAPDHHARGRQRDAVPAYREPMYGQSYPGAPAAISPPGHPLLMGARIKITRSFLIGGGKGGNSGASTETGVEGPPAVTAAGDAAVAAPRPHFSWRRGQGALRGSPLARSFAEKPLLDLGVGINLDVDRQQIQPVARIKIKDLVSIKAAPLGLLKISRSIPLGPVALKVRYELPLAHARHFWEPPARLMVRYGK